MSEDTPERWTWVEDVFRSGYSGIVDQDGAEVLFPDCCNDGDEGAAWFDTFPSEAHRLLIADAPRLKEANADLLAACENVLGDFRVAYNQDGTLDEKNFVIARSVLRDVQVAIAKAKTGAPDAF